MRLLLDTNVLLLWIVGSLRLDAVGKKRLGVFDTDDFALVEGLAAKTQKHISTPHILAEVSNFLGSGRQQVVEGGTGFLARYIAALDEIYLEAQTVALTPEFHAIGLTDASILHLAQTDTRVVSIDFYLCNLLALKGVDVINPRNLRVR